MQGTEQKIAREFPSHQFARSMNEFGQRWSAGHEGSMNDQFIRPAILLTDGTLSIDVVTFDGELVARLNISRLIETAFVNIDIIPSEKRVIRLASWDKGTRIFNYTLPAGKLVSVDLSKIEDKNE